MCQYIKEPDVNARSYKFVKSVSKNILENVIDIIFSEI